ncbi:MAG TPA: ABC transporter permease [Pantanalinema sp.]
MTFLDELKSVLSTLSAHRLRAFLTLLGIILGVGTLVLLSSVVEGAGKFMERRMMEASGDDVITLSKRWGDERSGKTTNALDRFDARALSSAPHLSGAQVLSLSSMTVSWGSRWGQQTYVVGTVPEALSFYALEVDKGRFLVQGDVWNRAKVAVLGAKAGSKLMKGVQEPLGEEIKLKGQRFRVIGVLKPKPTMGAGGFRTWDESVLVPETAFVDRLAQSKELNSIVVKASPTVLERLGLAHVVYAVRSIVLSRHHGIQNFRVSDPLEKGQSQAVAGLIVGGLEGAIALVCLVVGGINVMNIMLVTVAQRTREIGLRLAVGATKASIRRQFLTEAAILSGLGGILGVLGGTLIAWLLSMGLTMAFGYWPFVFMPVQAAVGFAAALVTGVVFGWYPARRASDLSPIDCLRYE